MNSTSNPLPIATFLPNGDGEDATAPHKMRAPVHFQQVFGAGYGSGGPEKRQRRHARI